MKGHRLLNLFLVLILLLDNLQLPPFLGFDFRINYIIIILYIIFRLFFSRHLKIKIKPFFFFLFIFLSVFTINLLTSISIVNFLKQFLLINTMLIFSYLLLESYKLQISKIFEDYILIIVLSSCILAIQILGSFFHFKFLIDYSYLGFDMGGVQLNTERGRFHSWFYEPSFMAYAFLPAAFASISRLFGLGNLISKRNAIFVILALLFTKSAIAFSGLFICLVIIVTSKYDVLRKPLFLIVALILMTFSGILMYNTNVVKKKVDETVNLFFNKNVTDTEIAHSNMSTYALFSNFRISVQSFKDRPLLGSGLGSYELVYDKYLYEVIPKSNWRDNFKINREDANSLFLRLLVETGLLGIVLIVLFVWLNRIKFTASQTPEKLNLWVINNGIFVLIVLRLLRQGHYTMLGFVLFLFIYYFSHLQYTRK